VRELRVSLVLDEPVVVVLSELGCVHPVSRQACEQVQTTVEHLC